MPKTRIAVQAWLLSAALALAAIACPACGQQATDAAVPQAETSAGAEAPAEPEPEPAPAEPNKALELPDFVGTEEQVAALAGSWAPVGVLYGDDAKLFKDNPTLADLYKNTYVTFYENGRFAYQKKVYIDRGTWKYYNEMNGMPCYVLKIDSVAQLTLESGIGGEEIDSKTGQVYFAYLSGDQPFLVLRKQGEDLKDTPLPVFIASDAYEVPMEASSVAEDRAEGQSEAQAKDESPSELTGFSATGVGGGSSQSNPTTNVSEPGTTDYFGDKDYIETDQGVVYKGEDGSLTLYYNDPDMGIVTNYPDGSMEWTDGYGTVTRDVDGDGTPEYISHDSGATWEEVQL